MSKPPTHDEEFRALLDVVRATLTLLAAANALEAFLPRPERQHDARDHEARRAGVCPACRARKGAACLWSEPASRSSWCAHPARRALVTTSSRD